MKTNSFKNFAILFSFIIIITTILFLHNSYNKKIPFSNNIDEFLGKLNSPFFFKQEANFYDINFNTGYNTRYNEFILDEWYKYLEGKIKIETITYFLLNNNSENKVLEIYNSMKNKRKFDLPEFNHLGYDKTFNFFEFIYFAKKIERSSNASKYSWNYNDVTIALIDNQIIDQLLPKYKTSKNSFLKNRYWFQIIKAYFYSSKKEELLSFFEKTKNNEPKNKLFYRALSYCAGIYKQQKNIAKANYLYSIIFENNPDNRAEIANNFHIKDNKSFNSSLLLAINDTEKIALWALYGFRADKKVAIEEIYKLNPESSHLDYLLPKLINEEEARFNSLIDKPVLLTKKKTKENIDMSIVYLVNKISTEKKTSNLYLWQLASAYLSLFYDPLLAKNQFNTLATDKISNDEIRALKLLCKITELDEQKSSYKIIYSELDWLYKIKTIKKDDLYSLKNIQEYCRKHMNYINSQTKRF